MNEMNNIKPCFWGKKYWGSIYSMAAVYPNNPNKEYIESIRMFFLSLRHTLPCEGCRISYTNFTSQPDTNIMNNKYLNNRDNFIGFIYRLRNKVNKKIGLEYNITKEYFKSKLDKMCCVDGNELDGYLNELSEAPFIPNDFDAIIHDYVYKNKMYINDYNNKYTEILIKKNIEFIKNPLFEINNKNFKLWFKRNSKCREIINKIYNNMSCGDYGMYDSFYRDKLLHLQLFYMGCSIIPYDDLKYIFTTKK